jgi:hypothetical protein
MPFTENHKLSKGRPKGKSNAITSDVRHLFSELLQSNINQLEADFKSIKEPHIRIKLILELAKFCIPTLKSIELESEPTNNASFTPITINIKRDDNK